MCSEVYFSASPLRMFRAAHTPIIRSTILTVSTAIGTIPIGYSIEYYDARNNKYQVNYFIL